MKARPAIVRLGGNRISRAGRQVIVAASTYGERKGWDWLTYHPGVFVLFHYIAMRNAEPFIQSIQAVFPEAKRLGDVGAGTGAYAAAARKAGLYATPYERSPVGRWIGSLQGLPRNDFDLTDKSTLEPIRGFDLAYSLEVAEHLPPELGEKLVDTLVRAAPIVVFTAAQPGQGGQGHVNEQPKSYWVEQFATRGATYDSDRSERLRAQFVERGVEDYLIENVVVFTR
jgi:hypothetical protein